MATKKTTTKGTSKKTTPVKKSVEPVQKTIEAEIAKEQEKKPVEAQTPAENGTPEPVNAKIPAKSETGESHAEQIVASQAKPAANVPVCEQDKDAHFELFGKPQFWRNHVSMARGLVHGAVIVSDMQEFFALAPKNLDLSKWMNEKDLVQDRIDKAKAKAKARKK